VPREDGDRRVLEEDARAAGQGDVRKPEHYSWYS
jgi:hypothetical protein